MRTSAAVPDTNWLNVSDLESTTSLSRGCCTGFFAPEREATDHRPKERDRHQRRASTQDRAVAIISAGQCTTNALRVTKRRNGRPVDTSSNYSRKPIKAHAQACPTNALHPSHSSSDSGDSEAILAGFCSHLAVHRRDCSDIQKSVLTSPKRS